MGKDGESGELPMLIYIPRTSKSDRFRSVGTVEPHQHFESYGDRRVFKCDGI